MMPVSPELIEICKAQVEVLADGRGASLCIVYLADNSPDRATENLVPIIVHPDSLMPWVNSDSLAWLGQGDRMDDEGYTAPPLPQFPMVGEMSDDSMVRGNLVGDRPTTGDGEAAATMPVGHPVPDDSHAIAPRKPDSSSSQQHQIALPLVYQGIVVGLLVTARPDRIWTEHEHHQIERIAKTISIACVVDRRAHWLEAHTQHPPQKQLQAYQHEVFDDLIHQFRNPLTALRTFGKLLMRRLQQSDRNFGVAESIVRESDRLQELLQQFKTALDVELPELDDWDERVTPPLLRGYEESDHASPGIPAPQTPLFQEDDSAVDQPVIDVSSSATYLTGHDISIAPCSLPKILAPLLDVAWAIAQEHDITLDIEMSPTLPTVLADPQGLREVLSNLIDNAIKYTPENGSVLIRVFNQPLERQAIIIADTGLGIPKQDCEHLFERYFRGVQAKGTIPGTGLGLAIAHDLLTKMEGQIEVFSPAMQAPLLKDWSPPPSNHPGTAFVVWLKKTAPTQSA